MGFGRQVSTVTFLELPRRRALSLVKSFVHRIDVSMRRHINRDEAPTGAFVSAADFLESNPVSQELLFGGVFRQDEAIGRVTTAHHNPGDHKFAVVFFCRYQVLFAESEHEERNIAKTVAVFADWFSPETLRLQNRAILLRNIKHDLDESIVWVRALSHARILRRKSDAGHSHLPCLPFWITVATSRSHSLTRLPGVCRFWHWIAGQFW